MTYRRVVTGATSFKFWIHLITRLNARYGAKLRAWITANVDAAYRAEVLALLDSIVSLDAIIQAAQDD